MKMVRFERNIYTAVAIMLIFLSNKVWRVQYTVYMYNVGVIWKQCGHCLTCTNMKSNNRAVFI